MKKFTILFLLLMLIGIATADLYTIGTGTSTQSYVPLYGLYDYSWSKVIYTATELSAAGLTAGPIDGIGFEVGNTPTNYVSADQRVYVRHTTTAAYETTDNALPDNAAFQNVYNADYTWNGGGWSYIMFSSAFNWDGTSNIEISWENWDGDYVSGYPNFRYTSTTPAYLAVYKYADNAFPGEATGTRYYNRPNIQIVTPSTTAPNAAVLGGPVDGSTLTTPIVNLSWSPGNGGLPTGYKLYLGTTTPPAFVADLGAVASYTASDLDYETIYYWQVVPYNVIGDATDCPVWSFTTMDNPVISSFPWTEDFGTVSGDWPVLNWTQRSGLYPDPTGTSVQWVRDEWLNGPTGNNAAKINIYGTSRYGWLITPPIAIPASGYELMFDLGLTRYGNANAVDPAQQMDDRFIVAISDSPDMSNPTLLREWNNSGSANVFNDIPNTGTMVIVNLDAYAGTKYIAFYGESTVSGGDNDLFVDNVTVREQAAGPIITVSPDAWDFGTQFVNTTHPKAFTITNTGSGSLSVSSVSVTGTGFALAETFSPVALLTGESANFTVNFLPTAAGVLTGSVMINDNRAVTNIPLSGECVDPTVYEIPWTEGFEAYNTHNTPIFGWMQEGIAGTTEWIANNTETTYNRAPKSGDWNAFLRYGNTRWMFKPVQLQAGIGYRAIVWARQDGAAATNASVGISFGNEPNAASMTETILDPTGIVNGDYQRLAGVFTPATSGIYYLGILGTINSSPWYISIDDIEIELMGANDLMAMGLSGNVTPSVGIASDYTISVYNNGTAPQSTYNVKLYDSNDVELATAAGVTIASGTTEDVVVSWTPTVDGPMSIYGKVILAGDINPSNDATNPILLSVQPEGVLSVTIGDGSATARMPLDFYYKSSLYQNIYSAAEIGTVGNISTLALYNQFSTASVPNTPVKIWLGLTAQENLNDGWISSNEMTLVFDGTMDFPGGQNTITFPLLAPFAYSGGNLVVMFYRPLDDNYYSSSDYFKTQTGDTGRARNMYSDSEVYDPASPTGGSTSGIFPQTTLFMTPMTGDPVFAVNPESHGFGDVNIGGARSQSFTIMNAGGGTLGINTISIAGSPTMVLSNLPALPAALGTGESAVFTVTYTPTALAEDIATVTVTDNLNARHVIGSGLRSANERVAHTIPLTGTGVNDITIGDGNQTALVPANFFWKSSLFETIYTADELSNFSGMIDGVRFYNQFVSDITATPIKIWMGSTTQSDLSADWIPSTGLTQVFNGVMDFPSGENIITITFPQPYMHSAGGNLVMMVNRPLDTLYYSSSDYFKTQTVGTNRSRAMYSDTVEYDPAAPTAGTVSGIFPKTTFIVNNSGIGSITGTVLGAGNTPLAGVLVNVNSRPYSATTNAQGQFSIANVVSGNYAASFSLAGYVTQTLNIVVVADEATVMNVTMSPTPNVNVTGTILAGDTGTGLAGASITLVGDETFNGTSIANGTFTIANVAPNHSYLYTISAEGYESASGNINVLAVDYSMGNITLSEIALPPNAVVAAESATAQSVNLSWQAPGAGGDSFEDDFEDYTDFAMQFGDWTTIDVDGSGTYGLTNTTWLNAYEPMAYMVFNPSATVPPVATAEPHSGDKFAASFAATTPPNNDWLITPQVMGGGQVSFWGRTFHPDYGLEQFKVGVSTTGTVPANFTIISGTASVQAPLVWTEFVYDLSAYAGQQIYVGIQCVSNDRFIFMVDDFYVGDTRIRTVSDAKQRSASDVPAYKMGPLEQRIAGIPSPVKTLVNPAPRNSTRALTGYKVYRLLAADQDDETAWTTLTPAAITAQTYVDAEWDTLPYDTYKWAVKAMYSGGVMSDPAFSNALAKIVMNGNIVGTVTKANGLPLAGATITATGGFTATSSTAGTYSLSVPIGIYSVTASFGSFDPLTHENITVTANQNTTVNFDMNYVANEDEIVPITVTALKGNYPNPFNPETTINYELKDATNVRLNVYNSKGQLVRTLVNADQAAGAYRLVFNGRDDNGKPLSSGIYLYRFTAGAYHSTRKMMLME